MSQDRSFQNTIGVGNTIKGIWKPRHKRHHCHEVDWTDTPNGQKNNQFILNLGHSHKAHNTFLDQDLSSGDIVIFGPEGTIIRYIPFSYTGVLDDVLGQLGKLDVLTNPWIQDSTIEIEKLSPQLQDLILEGTINITTQNTQTVMLGGNGTSANPLEQHAIISPKSGNTLINDVGLYVPNTELTLNGDELTFIDNKGDSNTIDLSSLSTPISPDIDNALTDTFNGLKVSNKLSQFDNDQDFITSQQVNDQELTVEGSGGLTGSGTFTQNASTNKTITIELSQQTDERIQKGESQHSWGDHSLVGYSLTDTTYSNGDGLNLSGTEFSVKFGQISGTAAEGDDSRIVNQVPNTRTINSKQLTSDISLDKTDIGLDNVDNTQDQNKSVQSAQTLSTPREINGVQFDGSQNITINAVDSTARIPSSEKGVQGGVQTLNGSGLIPSEQLPSYVDDVIEVQDYQNLPITGEDGKIYVTLDDGKIYRWAGVSGYIRINDQVTSSEEALKLQNAYKIQQTGDQTWEVNFDGSQNVSAQITLQNSGVVQGTYTKLTVDQKGRVTSGASPTDLQGYGITDQVSSSDSRLSDSREWTASEVTQSQAENNQDTTVYKWSPVRVWDQIKKFQESLKSSDITNDSGVTGQTVKDALDQLKGDVDQFSTIKRLETKTQNFSVSELDKDVLFQVGGVSDIVIALTQGTEPFLVRFKRPLGTAEVTFVSSGSQITDIDGNNQIREGGICIAYFDGQNWSLEGKLKYI